MEGRRSLLIGLTLVMILGIAVYFRLWIIDYRISSHDAQLLRRQFDLASKEAMDESAEWRHKFDEERLRVGKCKKELIKVKESFGNKVDCIRDADKKLEMLQKENIDLLERLEALKHELETEKLKCGSTMMG